MRVALGAQGGDVLRLVIRQGMILALAGIGAGLLLSFGATRVLASILFDTSPTDLVSFTAISALLAGIAAFASYLPARRALDVDPLESLRGEGGAGGVLRSSRHGRQDSDRPEEDRGVLPPASRPKLSLFGSVLRDDFGPDSDVDVLVEFEPGHVPGLSFLSMEEELSKILGRKADLKTSRIPQPLLPEQVLSEAEVHYAAA